MTLATLHGRLQTKAVTYLLALTTALVFVLATGNSAYWSLFAVMAIVGLVLETVWGLVITHQPGWVAFVFALAEFGYTAALAAVLGIPVSLAAGATYYTVTWIVTQLIVIYLFPVWYTKWADDGREIW
ncbi:MAG: hypothetical protein AAB538_00990 [Patescibacteria group bacterium]